MVLQNAKQFQMRVSEEFLARLDDWRRAQRDLPSRAEAIRRLVELGMKAPQGTPAKKGSKWGTR
jgi:metal-responsive CopG/Arc/MetJ family transcriptional regulator